MSRPRRDKIKWSPDLAYVVGLITSDGCLSKDGRHIEFTSNDIDLILTFKSILGLKVKIGHKTSGYTGKKYPRLQFGDIVLYNWLKSIGLMPKKSKIIGDLKIPRKYFFDFLRGLFDGDGCFYSYWDKRWKSSFMFYVDFCSASKKFLKWLRKSLSAHLEIRGNLKIGTNVWNLRFAKEEGLKIIKKMYYLSDVKCLARKKNKIIRAFKEGEEKFVLR
ncbi:MAG: LAGLIDADG family homing endonuclease [Patescibacteria group bacterium]|nr:LAGLIDADG family homing endonuclease [Patescibacteria group bacterium]